VGHFEGPSSPRGFELELIQTNMAQKPMLKVEVGARALRVRPVSREEAWASAGVQGAWVSECWCEADKCVLETVHDVFRGHLACGGISFYPHARPGAGGVPTTS
jgi:hypothetical protein